MKKQKTLLKVCRIIVIVLLAWTFIDGIILIVKGATNAGLASFIITFMNYAWLMFYNSQIQNVELTEFIDKQFKTIEFCNKIRSELLIERYRDFSVFNQRIDAIEEEIDKIIELSQKRMVNGLPQERYTCFINEVLSAITAFAERAKYKLRNGTYEPNEKLVKTMTNLKNLTYEVKNEK